MMRRQKPELKQLDTSKPIIDVEHGENGYRPVMTVGGCRHDSWMGDPFDTEAEALAAGLEAVRHLA